MEDPSTKSYPERIAAMLADAPPAPPLRRKSTADRAGVSEETKAKLLMAHLAYATFGHPPEKAQSFH